MRFIYFNLVLQYIANRRAKNFNRFKMLSESLAGKGF